MKPIIPIPGLIVLVDNHGCTYRVKIIEVKDYDNFVGDYRLTKGSDGKRSRRKIRTNGLFHPSNVRLSPKKTL